MKPIIGTEPWIAHLPKPVHAKKRRVLRAFRRAMHRGDERAKNKWMHANTKIDIRRYQ